MSHYRVKLLSVGYDLLMIILGKWRDFDNLALPELRGLWDLPQDARIHSITYNFGRRCFDLLIQSDQFAAVAAGEEPPRLGTVVDESVAFRRVRDVFYSIRTAPDTGETVEMATGLACRHCNGDGVYVGLNRSETCEFCHGTRRQH